MILTGKFRPPGLRHEVVFEARHRRHRRVGGPVAVKVSSGIGSGERPVGVIVMRRVSGGVLGGLDLMTSPRSLLSNVSSGDSSSRSVEDGAACSDDRDEALPAAASGRSSTSSKCV